MAGVDTETEGRGQELAIRGSISLPSSVSTHPTAANFNRTRKRSPHRNLRATSSKMKADSPDPTTTNSPAHTTAPPTSAPSTASAPPATNDTLEKLAPGVTLGAIARGTGLNVEYVSRIFNRKRTPSLRTAEKIAAFLKISIDQLLTAINQA